MPQAAAAALISYAGGTAVVGTIGAALITGAVDIGFSLAASELAKVIAGQPSSANQNAPLAGISLSYTYGENKPLSFPLGTFGGAGWRICPDMTHGTVGQTPNAYLTIVRAFSAVAGVQLKRVIVNGEYVGLGPDDGSGYGQPMTGKYAGFGWVKWYDGTQTAADPTLLANYASYPARPWSAAMIGKGICYAIFTFKVNRSLMPSEPTVALEVSGIPLYDPRLDSTVGGAGAHRWGDPSTYAGNCSDNAMVQAYNILRGITIGQRVWGYGASAGALPLDTWFAVMNACDASAQGLTGAEPAYRAGFMANVGMQPKDMLDKVKAAANAEFAEVGGQFLARVGAPGLPVYFFTDDDLVVTKAEGVQDYPGLQKTYNAVNATYPDPEALYQAKAAPTRKSAALEAADGDRFLPADLQLEACPYGGQVQRLQTALQLDNRRFRSITLTLPPDAEGITPLDSVAWTSARNGYATKAFELSQVSNDIRTVQQGITGRERDSSDYSYSASDVIATTAPVAAGLVPVSAQAIDGFAVAQAPQQDLATVARVPAILASWTATGADDIRAIRVELRRQSDQQIISVVHVDPSITAVVLSQGVVAGVTYEARATIEPFSGRATTPTNWAAVVAPDITVTPSAGSITPAMFETGTTPIEILAALPTTGNFIGRAVLLTTDGDLYRYTATGFVASIAADKITGTITGAQIGAGTVSPDKFASGTTPIEILAALPTTGNFSGRTVLLTTDGNLYRYTGGSFVATIAADKITGTITGAQIAASAVNTGQIADNAVTHAARVSGSTSFTSSDADAYEVSTLSMTTAGNTELVTFVSGELSFYQSNPPQISNQSYITLTFQIWQGSTMVFESGYYSEPQSSSTITLKFSEGLYLVSAGGAETFAVKIRHAFGQGISYTWTGEFSVLELKK